MPTARREPSEIQRNTHRGTTRRGLVAAAAAFAAMMATKKAYAFARPPGQVVRKDTQCFLRGICIRTPQGYTVVESLAIGDLVSTVGDAKAITWIGRLRLVRREGEQWSSDVLPVRVARAALGDQVPRRDLYLSPSHALYVDGLLVPVRTLINGRTILLSDPSQFDVIDYFHIEVAGHDVTFAEDAPAETLLTRSEVAFDNWSDAEAAAHADRPAPKLFAPRLPAYGGVERSRLRTAIFPWIDRRRPIDDIWERLAERAETDLAA